MNYKKITILVMHQFEWEKNFFFFTILATLLTKLIFLKFNIHPFFVIFGLVASAIPALYYMRPEFSGHERSFSAKYLISFPISRKELIIGSTIVSVITTIPLLMWLICFNSNLALISPFFKNNTSAPFNLLCLAVLAGSSSLPTLFFKARGVQWKPKFSELAFEMASFVSFIVFIPIATVALSAFVERQFSWNLGKYVSVFFDSIPLIVESPWLGIIILTYACYIFYNALTVSEKEIKSYRVPWSLKKDLIQTSGFGFASVVCLVLTLSAIPKVFEGDMQAVVYDLDYKKIEELLSNGIDINKPNAYGVTPMMVAIKKGDLKFVEFMESKGASYSGEVKKANDLYDGYDTRMLAAFSGNVELLKFIKDKVPSYNNSNAVKTFNPIHVAALFCKSKVVDYLIDNGVNIEIKNNKGFTPVVLAAKQNCFESVISLKEAGARFDVVDTNGKLALQNLGKKASPELKFFVEKNMRAPASK